MVRRNRWLSRLEARVSRVLVAASGGDDDDDKDGIVQAYISTLSDSDLTTLIEATGWEAEEGSNQEVLDIDGFTPDEIVEAYKRLLIAAKSETAVKSGERIPILTPL